jgi:hypothetical protein
MPAVEEQVTEFRCTVLHSGRRITVTLPHKHHYTVEEVLRELREAEIEIDFCSTSVCPTGITVEHGSVIDLGCHASVYPANVDPSQFRCTVLFQDCRFNVTFPCQHHQTVEEMRRLIKAHPDGGCHLDRCVVPSKDMTIQDGDEIRFNPKGLNWGQRGYLVEIVVKDSVEQITVFQDGWICYVIRRKIKGTK